MKRRIAPLAWLVASVIVLGWWYYYFESNPELTRVLRNKSQIYLIIAMVILSFPIAAIYIFFFGFVVYGLDSMAVNLHQYEIIEVISMWGGFVLSGYLQWFVFLPFIIKKFRRKSRTNGVNP